MHVVVSYYGQAGHAVGIDRERLEIEAKATLRQVCAEMARRHGAAFADLVLAPGGDLRGNVLVSINDEVVDREQDPVLESGDEVAFFTALSGG